MSAHAIQARDLTKVFTGGIVGVASLDLEVEQGCVYGLIGRNGAGKTTTLRLLMGLLRPTHGAAEVLGWNLASASQAVRSRVAYVSQSMQLPGWMTVGELSRYVSSFYASWDSDLFGSLARRWEVPLDREVGRLSGGQQRRLGIILALAPRPQVLLLDEPAAGLDPIARREFLDELISVLTIGDGCTVVLSTHLITDLERIAERIGILDRGRMVLDSRLDDLQIRTRRVQVIFPGDSVPSDFRIPGSRQLQVSGPVATAVTQFPDGEYLDALRRKPGVRVHVFPLNLEEIFVELVGRRPASEPATDTLNAVTNGHPHMPASRNGHATL